jgi:hypothetical protein
VFHRVSPCFTVFHRVSPCFTVSHRVSPCFTVFHRVSPCFTVYHRREKNGTVISTASLRYLAGDFAKIKKCNFSPALRNRFYKKICRNKTFFQDNFYSKSFRLERDSNPRNFLKFLPKSYFQ